MTNDETREGAGEMENGKLKMENGGEGMEARGHISCFDESWFINWGRREFRMTKFE